MAQVALSEAQRELVAFEAEQIAKGAASARTKEAFERLSSFAAAVELPEELAPALGELLSLGLSTGRIRAVHGPHGEMEAVSLFRRTPQGKAFHAQFDDVNAMLAAFKGQELRQISLSARGPGMFTLLLETETARVTISLAKDEVDVRSVEVAI